MSGRFITAANGSRANRRPLLTGRRTGCNSSLPPRPMAARQSGSKVGLLMGKLYDDKAIAWASFQAATACAIVFTSKRRCYGAKSSSRIGRTCQRRLRVRLHRAKNHGDRRTPTKGVNPMGTVDVSSAVSRDQLLIRIAGVSPMTVVRCGRSELLGLAKQRTPQLWRKEVACWKARVTGMKSVHRSHSCLAASSAKWNVRVHRGRSPEANQLIRPSAKRSGWRFFRRT